MARVQLTLVIENVRPAEEQSLDGGGGRVLQPDNVQARSAEEEQPFAIRVDCVGSAPAINPFHSRLTRLAGEVEHGSDGHDEVYDCELVRVGQGARRVRIG